MSVYSYLVIIINVVNIVPCINMFYDVSCTCMFQSMYVHCTFFQRNLFNFITKILGHILTFFLFFSSIEMHKNTRILIIFFFFKQKKYLKDGDNSNFRSTPFKKYDHGGNDRIDAADSEVKG